MRLFNGQTSCPVPGKLLEVLSADGLVTASGSAGNFEMMNRILDAAGIPVPQSMHNSIGPMIGL